LTATLPRNAGTALGRPTVLELSSPVTAVAGRLLADAGARVVKLEDPAAVVSGRPEDRARRLYQDTDKRSVSVALDSPRGRELFARLAPRFDIVRRSPEGLEDETDTEFGLSGGIELNLLNGLGVHASYDAVFVDGGNPGVFGVGAHYTFAVPGL